MTVLFDGQLHVHYGQFYVESRTDDFFEGLTESRGGQVNGLCGAAVPGLLFLTTGLHTGTVEVTVEVLDARPPVGDDWEEVVEHRWSRRWYHSQYRYLLQFWTAPPAADDVVRQTSECAAYWHAHARTLPPPPTPEQRAEATRQQRLARERAHREAARAAELRRWDGRPPSERVRRVNGGVVMARMDRDLVDSIEKLDEATQRAVAIWAANRACDEAGLTDVDWVAPALAALERGEPLPPPFDDHGSAFGHLHADGVPRTAVPSYDGRHDRVSQQHAALPALWAAADADPLTAALESLFHAVVTFGNGYPRLLTEVRQRCDRGH